MSRIDRWTITYLSRPRRARVRLDGWILRRHVELPDGDLLRRSQMHAMPLKQESRAYFRALGVHISALRKERDMTQAELARALGVSQQTVFAYELGERCVSLFRLLTLAKIFSVPVEQLMGMTKPPRKLYY